MAEVAAPNAYATGESLLRGRLPLAQPKTGYRTNADALWLAAFARGKRPARRVLDLGAGVGAVGLALLVNAGARAATLLDVDAAILVYARKNAEAAGRADDVTVINADVHGKLPASLHGAFDLVVANPPYGVSHAARRSPDEGKARARIGEPDTLLAFARAARIALGAAGRVCFVYPASDLPRVLATLRQVGLEPKRARMVHPLQDGPARVALVEAKPGRPGGLRIDPPLTVMRVPGEWTDEAKSIVEGG